MVAGEAGPATGPLDEGTVSMARGFHLAPGTEAQMREAQNPNLTKSELLPLGSSRSTAVRAIVAGRQDCPLGLMVALAHDFHVDVRCAIASNPSAQRSVLAYLAADRHVEVVLAVVRNPSLPGDILDDLAFHRKSVVKQAAIERLNAGTAHSRVEQQRSAVLEDSRVPEVAEQSVASLNSGPRVDGNRSVEYTFAPAGATRTDLPVPVTQGDGEAAHPDSAALPVVVDQREPAPHFTRTAPVRGFRPPDERVR